MKQTAVEWLLKELEEQKLIKLDKLGTTVFNKNFATRYELIIEQAKEMEKKQIVNAASNKNIFKIVEYWLNKQPSNLSLFEWRCKIEKDGEEYYNETFKKK